MEYEPSDGEIPLHRAPLLVCQVCLDWPDDRDPTKARPCPCCDDLLVLPVEEARAG